MFGEDRDDGLMQILAISNSMEVIQIQEDLDLSLCAEPIVHLFQGLRLLCFIFFNKFIQIVFILPCASKDINVSHQKTFFLPPKFVFHNFGFWQSKLRDMELFNFGLVRCKSPKFFFLMEDNLTFSKMGEDLNFSKMGDYLNFFKNEWQFQKNIIFLYNPSV